MASGYQSATEHLAEATAEQHLSEDCLHHGIHILGQIPDDASFNDVTEHLTTTADDLDSARITSDSALARLDEAHSYLDATGEQYLTGLLNDLIQHVQDSAETLSSILNDVTEELAAAGAEVDAEDNTPTARTTDAGSDPTPSPDTVKARIAELRRQGHAPQRHGPQVTDQQLTDRALYGIDPMTGTTTDGETGRPHKYGRNATRFTTSTALVQAENYLRNSAEFETQKRDYETTGDPLIKLDVPLKRGFGAGLPWACSGNPPPWIKVKTNGRSAGNLDPHCDRLHRRYNVRFLP